MQTAIDYSNYKQETINGKVYYMSPSASPKHNKIMNRLTTAFDNYLENRNCEAHLDIDVHLDDDNCISPDISVVCDKSKIKSNGYFGVPSLIIEILSSNKKLDRKTKYELYEKFGVKEYWIVDQLGNSIEQYVLQDSKYKLIDVVGVLADWEFDKLSDLEKSEYTTIIKPTVFEELAIDLSMIFKNYY